MITWRIQNKQMLILHNYKQSKYKMYILFLFYLLSEKIW